MFLRAYWRNLIVVNYVVDPAIVSPYLPRGVELDTYKGTQFMSLVALHFSRNRLLGIIPSIPFSFNEINLRFYVTRLVGGEKRRGVVFIREIVPSSIITSIARLLYNEPYTTLKTNRYEDASHVSYSWGSDDANYQVRCERQGELQNIDKESLQDFILERYWGYTPQPNGSTVEYQVKHKPWRYWDIASFEQQGDLGGLYGEHFRSTFERGPHSVFLAEGSVADVSMPRRFFAPLSMERPVGWVLYDGTCGMCSKLAATWRPHVESIGFECAPNNAEWVRERASHLGDELGADMRILFRDGRVLSGANAYLFLMRRIWWLKPIGVLLGLPGIRYLTSWAYEEIKRRRHLLSRACGLGSSDQ